MPPISNKLWEVSPLCVCVCVRACVCACVCAKEEKKGAIPCASQIWANPGYAPGCSMGLFSITVDYYDSTCSQMCHTLAKQGVQHTQPEPHSR